MNLLFQNQLMVDTILDEQTQLDQSLIKSYLHREILFWNWNKFGMKLGEIKSQTAKENFGMNKI